MRAISRRRTCARCASVCRASSISSPKRPVPADPREARALYALAQQQERAGERTAAIANLTQAVALDPGFASAHQLLGILYGEGGDAERAAAAFARAVALE